MSNDPIGFNAGDPNLYRYVGNQATTTVDPTGLWWWDDDWIELGLGGLLGIHGQEVLEAAGNSIVTNPGRDVLDTISYVDPTPLSGGVNSVLTGTLEGESPWVIAGNVGLEFLPGPSPKKGCKVVNAIGDAPTGPRFPGIDVTKAPDGFEWRGKPGSEPGSNEGNYYNPETGESLRPDLNHPDPIGSHWDYRDSDGEWWKIFPDGSMEAK